MTTATAPAILASYIVVAYCDDHGTISAGDYLTARTCVEVATECLRDTLTEVVRGVSHADEHARDESCWVCCNKQVIDPAGIFDH